jgi:hypothetical protein
MDRVWIYHKTEEPRVVTVTEAREYYNKGWADTPAAFLEKDSEKGTEKPALTPEVEATIDVVRAAINGALNLDNMTKAQLIDYGKGPPWCMDFGPDMLKAEILEKIKAEVLDEDSEEPPEPEDETTETPGVESLADAFKNSQEQAGNVANAGAEHGNG